MEPLSPWGPVMPAAPLIPCDDKETFSCIKKAESHTSELYGGLTNSQSIPEL